MRNVFSVALLLCAGAAHAGGPVVVLDEQPVVVPATSDWTGFRVGLAAVSGNYDDSVNDLGTRGYGLHAAYLNDFGRFVLGGELGYLSGDFDSGVFDWTSTRLKLIGGYDAGRILPYGFIGLSRYELSDTVVATSESDTLTLYGVGAKLAVWQQIDVGLEYFVETTDDFADGGIPLDNTGLTLSVDYRF